MSRKANLIQGSAIPNPGTLLRKILPLYNAEFQPVLMWCRNKANVNTSMSYGQTQNIAELNPLFSHCWDIPNLNTLLK